jgi:lipopolysaccharide transport system ATP-binding protein
MGSTVIKVEDVGKQFRLGMVGTGTLSTDIQRWYYRVRGLEDPFLKIGEMNDRATKGQSDVVWALRDINFEVQQGEVLGIVGRNGAGKSTLLKLLSRVTKPTTGSIKVRGRIASLLEVGTGFHPELSGRENIFLNGAILGMSKSEIRSKFDEIVDFSGVERYIDTPVKRYSSGMYVRLAFAVAAHLEPEILIIDEVLAVGDAEFQKKCLGKMKDVSGQGRTVLFVSHNMAAVKALCTNCLLLENGMVKMVGETEYVINRYMANRQSTHLSPAQLIPDNEYIEVKDVNLMSQNEFAISEDIILELEFNVLKQMEKFNFSLVLYDEYETPIFNSISNVVQITPGHYRASVVFPKNFLNDTYYCIRLLAVQNSKAIFDVNNLVSFDACEIQSRNFDWYGKFIGVIRPNLHWSITSTK